MKKRTALLSAFAISLFSLSGLSLNVLAETTATTDAKATFDLVAPKDSLKIINATDLTFTEGVIAASDIVTTNSSNSSITVQELSGLAPGWQLSAKLGNFVGTVSDRTLSGAQVFYPSVTPTTNNFGDISAILPVSTNTGSAFEGSGEGQIITAGGDATNIVTAAAGKGYGSWTMTYPQGQVQLKVPAGNLKDNYTATLTYTLVDTPQ